MDSPESDRPTMHRTPATGGSGASGAKLPEPSLPQEDLTGDPLLAKFPRDERNRPLLGRIPVVRRIGRGGMGAVYYGLHPRLKIEVAVKILPYHLVEEDPKLVERFASEARMAAMIGSDHVVRVLDVDEDQGTHFLVMEFVAGESAGALLKRRLAEGKPGLSEDEALDIVIAAARGLAAAHARGIVHRDIKPDNILIPGGEFRRAKLADLGLARPDAASQTYGTQANIAMGTPGFMAPEQVEDARSAGPPADLFSMGATLHALLCGRSPFHATSLATTLRRTTDDAPDVLPAAVRQSVRDLVAACLARKPEQRPRDAAALIAALEAIRGGSSASTGPTQFAIPNTMVPSPVPAPTYSMNPWVATAALLTVVLAAVGAFALLSRKDPAPTATPPPAPTASPVPVPTALPSAEPTPDPDRARRFRRILESADELAISAEAKGTTDAWRPVLFALSKAELLASTKAEREEVAGLLAMARQRLGWAEARQAEERGDLEAALALAKKAIEGGPPSPELVGYYNGLVKRWNDEEIHRKEEFLRLRGLAEAEPDLEKSLALWTEALGMAMSDEDRTTCRKEMIRLSKEILAAKGGGAEPEALLEEARKLHAEGDLEGALAKLSLAIERRPAWAEAYAERTAVRRAKGDLDGALLDAGRALELEPENLQYLDARAWIRFSLTDFPGTEADCTKLLAIQKGEIAHYLRGLARKHRGDYPGAIADFDATVELTSRKAYYLSKRASTHWEFGHYDKAEADFAAASALEPTEVAIYQDWGWYFVRRGRPDDAIRKADEGIKVDPNSANSYNVRGYAKLMKGDLEGSLADYDRALELDPAEVAFLSTRGYVHARLGHFDAARADLEEGQRVSKYRRGDFWIKYWTASLQVLETRKLPEAEHAAGFAKALDLLAEAMKSPFVDGDCMCHVTQKDHLREDPDYAELRSDPRFIALVKAR